MSGAGRGTTSTPVMATRGPVEHGLGGEDDAIDEHVALTSPSSGCDVAATEMQHDNVVIGADQHRGAPSGGDDWASRAVASESTLALSSSATESRSSGRTCLSSFASITVA